SIDSSGMLRLTEQGYYNHNYFGDSYWVEFVAAFFSDSLTNDGDSILTYTDYLGVAWGVNTGDVVMEGISSENPGMIGNGDIEQRFYPDYNPSVNANMVGGTIFLPSPSVDTGEYTVRMGWLDES